MYLEINNLYKGFGEADSRVEVLKDISFGVEKGEICVMLGPSGSGKSTLLNIVGGIESADSGSVRVGEDELEAMNEKKLSGYRRKHLGYILVDNILQYISIWVVPTRYPYVTSFTIPINIIFI